MSDLGVTHFNFQHRAFRAPGARFLLKGQPRVPMFRVDVGGLDGLIDIDDLRKEFNITPDSHDGKLMELAVQGLRFVPDIKPDDAIPSELLTGQASWTISDKHKVIAQQRLQIQLLSWVSGKEVLLTDITAIATFLEQLENREKLRSAFRNAAVALGFAPDNSDAVVTQLELLARELSYIEALRDRYSMIGKIAKALTVLGKSYGSDRSAKTEHNRVEQLLQLGIDEFTGIFAAADAQTGEIIAALKTIDRQITYIRGVRDDLRSILMQWEPHIRNLSKWHTRRTPDTDNAFSELYRFLAPRYSSGRSLLKRREGAASSASAGRSLLKPTNEAISAASEAKPRGKPPPP